MAPAKHLRRISLVFDWETAVQKIVIATGTSAPLFENRVAGTLKRRHLVVVDLTKAMRFNKMIQKAGTMVRPNPPLDPATEKELRGYYLDDITAREGLPGRSLAEWKTGPAEWE